MSCNHLVSLWGLYSGDWSISSFNHVYEDVQDIKNDYSIERESDLKHEIYFNYCPLCGEKLCTN